MYDQKYSKHKNLGGYKSDVSCQAWWCMPLIPALGRQRQADFWVRGQPGLQSEFQDSQGYTEKPCLKNKTKQNKTKQNKTKKWCNLWAPGTVFYSYFILANFSLESASTHSYWGVCLSDPLLLSEISVLWANSNVARLKSQTEKSAFSSGALSFLFVCLFV